MKELDKNDDFDNEVQLSLSEQKNDPSHSEAGLLTVVSENLSAETTLDTDSLRKPQAAANQKDEYQVVESEKQTVKHNHFKLLNIGVVLAALITGAGGFYGFTHYYKEKESRELLTTINTLSDKIELSNQKLTNFSKKLELLASNTKKIESLNVKLEHLTNELNDLKMLHTGVENNTKQLKELKDSINLVSNNSKADIEEAIELTAKKFKSKVDSVLLDSKKWTNKQLHKNMDKVVQYLGDVIAELKINSQHQQSEISKLNIKLNNFKK